MVNQPDYPRNLSTMKQAEVSTRVLPCIIGEITMTELIDHTLSNRIVKHNAY